MTTAQAKHFLLSFDDNALIQWHNSFFNPWDDYGYATIRPNDPNELKEIIGNVISMADFITLCHGPKTAYNPSDKWVILTADRVFSFNRFEDYMATEYGDLLAETFLENKQDNTDDLNRYQANE